MMHIDKSTALAMAIRQIESSFGKGAVMQLGSTKIAEKVEVISTGSLSLDLALGVGGLPRGCVFSLLYLIEPTFSALIDLDPIVAWSRSTAPRVRARPHSH
jgi:hypothetical protein